MKVLYFATAAQITGCASEVWEVDQPLTVAEFWDDAIRRHPGLSGLRSTCRLASGHQYLAATESLDPAFEVAVLPPVSGG